MAIIDRPQDYFNTVLYTGNGSTQSITGVGFQPDLIWVKSRSNTEPHIWTDVVRGANKNIRSNATSSEFTDANNITSFDSDGFSVGTGGAVNENTYTFASWNWKAGTSVSGDTTGSGTLKTYTGSVNTTSGFSIIKYTGNGTAGHTIPHRLGVVPKMFIVKSPSIADDGWFVYNGVQGATKNFRMEATGAVGTSTVYWNDTEPTSSVFTVGNDGGSNANDVSLIAYCFAEKQGYSKFGSYVGNGNADGSFIYTGFKPAFVIYKGASGTGTTDNWEMIDNKRTDGTIGNPKNEVLYPNANNAEGVNATDRLDLLSNGFKMRTGSSDYNASGSTYIYMAFAEAPLVGTNNVPCTAR